MNEQSFLAMVKQNGRYGSKGEASRAAHAVFGTIKAWLSPTASDEVRQALPGDASQLWQYAPVACNSSSRVLPGASEVSGGSVHFILKVQQSGKYCSSREARRAARSVFHALTRSLAVESVDFLRHVFPPDVVGACHAGTSRAA
jgi:uncharacterized protein (DUF2267 family)